MRKMLVCGGLLCAVITAGCGKSAPTLKGYFKGFVPAQQIIGQPVIMSFGVVNDGPTIHGLTLWFQGLGSWTIDSVQIAKNGQQLNPGGNVDVFDDGNAWNIGTLKTGHAKVLKFEAVPKSAGNPNLSLTAYAGGDTTGTEIQGDGLQWTPAINPY